MTRRAFALLDQAGADRPKGLHVEAPRAETVGKQTGDGGSDAGSGPSSADVYVFESIGGWFGVTADDFVRDVAGLDVAHINLHLNSPGGDAWEGTAIANVLRQHKAEVTVWVDGIAASAASVIAMAGDQVVMGIGSQLMVHDAWTVAIGNAAELRKEAEVADSVSNALSSAYAAKAGGTAADWRAVMQAETWYTADEAVAAGLADRVATADDKGSAGGDQVVPGASSSSWSMWDSLASSDRHMPTVAKAFAYAGREAAPPPRIPPGAGHGTQTPVATASGTTHDERSTTVAFTDEHLAALRTKLGLAADADEDSIVASVTEVMDEFVKDDSPKQAALPEGTVAVDKAVWEQTRTDAAAGREARAQQQAERREQLVNAAVKAGRTTPAARDFWLNKLQIEGTVAEEQLASLQPGLVPVAELGHATGDAMTVAAEVLTDAELDGLSAFLHVDKEALRG